MKKLFLVIVLALIIPSSAIGIEWTRANQVTVAWDDTQVYTLPESLKYRVFIVPENTPKENAVEVGITDLKEFTITLESNGRYFVGAQTVLLYDGVEEAQSVIIWSDDPLVCKDGKTFGVKFFNPPGKPGGLRIR